MNIRSALYTGVLALTVLAGPAGAFAQTSPTPVPTGGRNPFQYAQERNNTIQTRSGLTGTSDLPTIVGNIINIVLSFLGILLLVYLVYAGFLWMTSSDSKGPEKAKEMIRNAIIGLIIIVSSFAISNFVLNALPSVTGAR